MTIDDFTDAFIKKVCDHASRPYCQNYPWFADDAKQIALVALYELRQRLHNAAYKMLNSRNIYYVASREIGRALAKESKHSGDVLFDLPAIEDVGIDFTEKLLLQDRWKRLDTVEKQVLRQYYFLGKTQQQISEQQKCSQPRIAQIIRQAIDKMGSE